VPTALHGDPRALIRRILTNPLLSQMDIAPSSQRASLFPFDAPELSLWYSGQTALWQAGAMLGMRPGERILVPAYCCGFEVAVLCQYGFRLSYYRILPDLRPDLAHLAALCQEPARALLLIHHFGLSQITAPLLQFVRDHDLLLIEDCAHGLYSTTLDRLPLGSFGDAAIFSLRKSLPLPDGGALVVRQRNGAAVAGHGRRPGLIKAAGRMKYLLEKEAESRWPRLVDAARMIPQVLPVWRQARASASSPAAPEAAARFDFDHARGAWRMSRLAHFILERVDHHAIRAQRQRAYRMLQEGVRQGSRLRPLTCGVHPGACPWLFPVWAHDPARLRRHLLARDIESHCFWATPHPDVPALGFQFEDALRGHVLVLPVHQNLRPADLEKMIHVLNCWNEDS
jgi:perosamine synthetase